MRLSVSARRVHDSHPYRSTDTTSDLYRWNFVKKLMLLFQMRDSFAMAAVAKAILVRISVVRGPYSYSVN